MLQIPVIVYLHTAPARDFPVIVYLHSAPALDFPVILIILPFFNGQQ